MITSKYSSRVVCSPIDCPRCSPNLCVDVEVLCCLQVGVGSGLPISLRYIAPSPVRRPPSSCLSIPRWGKVTTIIGTIRGVSGFSQPEWAKPGMFSLTGVCGALQCRRPGALCRVCRCQVAQGQNAGPCLGCHTAQLRYLRPRQAIRLAR